ncbi:MAG: DDE-type integrase/transposase/recombinase, partial [Gammaproteobacteria bacterium]|nr:DDE-type integrase/transposase/recombinase [Gammaproteobacteria bacterium]
KVFKQFHNQEDREEEEERLSAAVADRKQGGGGRQQPPCEICGKTNHMSEKCYTQIDCTYCGNKGHPDKFCRARIRDEKKEKEEESSVKPQSSNGSVSIGSRFGNNKKSNAYSDELVFYDTTDVPYASPEPNVTDHHISSVVALLLTTHHRLNVTMLFRIIIDSGASSHMLPRSMLCLNYRQSAGIVRLGDTSKTLSIMGKGDTSSEYVVDVLNVQDLSMGILAVCQFDRMQCNTVFADGRGIVYNVHGEVIFTATLNEDGTYLLDDEYVERLRSGTTPGMYEMHEQHLSSTEILPSIVTDSYKSPGVHTSCNASVPGKSDSAKNVEEAVRPRALRIPETEHSSTYGLKGNTTIPVGDMVDTCHDDSVHRVHTSTKALEGETQPTSANFNDINANSSHDVYSTGTGLNPLDILHRQWGHMGADRIKKTVKDGLVKGCKYSYRDIKDLELHPCDTCMQGRMRARPESKTTDHDWGPMEKIAIDYKGDFARKAIGGYKGFMLLVDYATNWVHAELVKSKAEHTRVLQDFKVKYVMRYDCTWKVLQSDSESIFKSRRVRQWLSKNEIRLQLSTPYQHWQNGQVEVYVRIVMDKSRTLMLVYNTPIKYWGYAVLYACYMLNRTPNTNTNISAYQALTNTIPDLSNAVPFYAPGVYHLTSDERKDPWSPKARPCRMLGYADKYLRAYYILNRVIVRENCIFDPVAIALEEEEVEVDQDADRDDIDEFEIMIDEEDSDVEESDTNSDVSDDVVEDVTDEVDEVENEVEIDYGGDAPYWFALREELTAILYNTHYTLYDEWRNACILATGLVQPLPPNPATVDEALSGPHADLWRAAITKELDQFRLRTTFGPAEQSGQGMKTKLILYYKYDGEYNLVCKARLVVCGYSQRKNVDYFDTYSPTTTVTTVFALLCLAGYLKSHLCTFDVSAAFLEGRADTRMFAWLPRDIDHEGVSKRIEILGNWYGSKQAGKIWNDLYDQIAATMNFIRSMDNPCLYKWTRGVEYIYQTVHVDDGCALCSSKKLAEEFMEVFLTHVRKAVMFDDAKLYLSMDITRSADLTMFYVSQQRYIEGHFGDFTKKYRTPMSTTVNLRLADPNTANESLLPITGKLRWLADRTRPDILVALGEVSTGGAEDPSDLHVQVATRIQHYLTTTKEKRLCLGGTDPIILFGYCDASYITVGKSKSRLGSCLFLNKTSGSISSVSRNDKTVSHSSCEA